MSILLDTNIIIEHLTTDGVAIKRDDCAISVITEAELLRLPGMESREIGLIEELLANFTILPIDSTIARRAAYLGRTRKIKLPDLLIAATAVSHGLILITKNITDFKNIPNLSVRTTIS